MGCLNVKSHQTTYQTLENNIKPYHTILKYSPSACTGHIMHKSYRLYIKQRLISKPCKGASRACRNYCIAFRRKKNELKPRFNHLDHMIVSNLLSFKELCSIKTNLTVLADGDGGRDINSFEKNTVPYYLCPFWFKNVQNKSHFCGFNMVQSHISQEITS